MLNYQDFVSRVNGLKWSRAVVNSCHFGAVACLTFFVGAPMDAFAAADEPPPLVSQPLYHIKPITDRADSRPSWHAEYKFGRVNLLEKFRISQDGKVIIDDVSELQHTFLMRNVTGRALSIDAMEVENNSVSADIADPNYTKLPFILAANAELKVTVTIAPESVNGGPISETVKLKMNGQAAPLGAMTLTGHIENGISFEGQKLIQGAIHLPATFQGVKVQRLLKLKLDRRLPQFLPQGTKLRMVSTNKNITIRPAELAEPGVTGVLGGIQFDEDIISFINDKQQLAADVSILYLIEVDPATPVGLLTGHLVLATSLPSPVGMLRQISVPISLTVLPHK